MTASSSPARPEARLLGRTWKAMVAVLVAVLLPLLGLPGFNASVGAAGNPSADLDQCANGGVGDTELQCATVSSSGNWVNGNLGASKAHYYEGDSVPYRLRFDSLDTSTPHVVVVEWDTTKAGKHALDYLTSYDRTETDASPTSGVTGLPGTSSIATIPADTVMQARGDWSGSQVAGNLTMWGGSITGVSTYSYSGDWSGQTSARLTITFDAAVANPVLAWGGHIATRADWGVNNSAIAISGSPYHMRLIDLDGAGGNQDRSLSEQAVIFPGSITIVKVASAHSSTSFPFTATGLTPASFSLVDDGDGPGVDTQTFPSLTTFGTYSVRESGSEGWSLTGLTCADPDEGSSRDLGTRTATIDLDEGEAITCTFTNTAGSIDVPPDISVTKTASPTSVPTTGGDVTFTFVVTNNASETATITILADDVFGTLDGDDDCTVGTVLPADGGSCSFSITRRLAGTTTNPHRDVFKATARDPEGHEDMATDDAIVQFTTSNPPTPPTPGVDHPQIVVEKSASAPTVHDGDAVTYTYVVTNPGGVSLRTIEVSDDRCAPVTYRSGDADTDGLLDVGEAWSYTCTATLHDTTQNTATASGRDPYGAVVTDQDAALVTVIHPAVAIDKSASVSSAQAGDTVTYTYAVTNPGTDPVTDVVVTDDRCGPVTYQSGDVDHDEALDHGETWTYTCAAQVPDITGLLTNVGIVDAVDELGAVLSDADQVSVTVEPANVAPSNLEPDHELAFTGVDAARVAGAGMALIALGGALVLSGRRRPRSR